MKFLENTLSPFNLAFAFLNVKFETERDGATAMISFEGLLSTVLLKLSRYLLELF